MMRGASSPQVDSPARRLVDCLPRGAVAGLAAVWLLAACGEPVQTAGQGPRKSDQLASAGTTAGGPGHHQAVGWKPGDAAAWEAQIKARTLGQNDHARPPSQR